MDYGCINPVPHTADERACRVSVRHVSAGTAVVRVLTVIHDVPPKLRHDAARAERGAAAVLAAHAHVLLDAVDRPHRRPRLRQDGDREEGEGGHCEVFEGDGPVVVRTPDREAGVHQHQQGEGGGEEEDDGEDDGGGAVGLPGGSRVGPPGEAHAVHDLCQCDLWTQQRIPQQAVARPEDAAIGQTVPPRPDRSLVGERNRIHVREGTLSAGERADAVVDAAARGGVGSGGSGDRGVKLLARHDPSRRHPDRIRCSVHHRVEGVPLGKVGGGFDHQYLGRRPPRV
mmetsp:Transcript_36770/g.72318  ORF Transcript_36770/g.72318 Transcript_36770/m.72318 type:complete len:285 (-) Transcript_36770:146-1000(-)|eukprot:CAMPEP_0194334862 /NCGR_PEP_ID=MMETSP0171-20130528/67527_1 /TAXON_ID=218684 /ORGANISM="Corethron pennatum, Strain L29A3" /LENGTH=284 /DNA_ID=CAMNT_0039097693 /DNA_START=149 /DNA_END=1003 /DNA_ORIENTATION=-